MAVKRITTAPTPKERAAMDRVTRAKKSYPRIDRHGAYRELCAELATETGADVVSIWEEFQERAGTRMYCGELEIEDAERLAMDDVRERFSALRTS
jgi:hypothetical protein